MPRGPKGEKRPADVIGNAVHVMRIATGEILDASKGPSQPSGESDKESMKVLGRAGGLKGGRARAEKLAPAARVEIARKAAAKRWRKHGHD